jgi:hypothetical protein
MFIKIYSAYCYINKLNTPIDRGKIITLYGNK